MNTRGFLDHLLQTAQSGLKTTGLATDRPQGGIGLSEFGKGSLAGGALGLLLGSNRTTRKLAKYGGLAALGMMAYKAYGSWQAERGQGGGVHAGSAGTTAAPAQPALAAPPALTAPSEADSRVLLRALIAAAKADGHIDDAERSLIDRAISQSGADAELGQWLVAEIARPLDPAEIARGIDNPALAAEVYLISAATVAERSYMEQAYLDGLAGALRLAPDLRARLDSQIAEA